MTKYSMRDDLKKYPLFFFDELTREILPADYERFESLQKLIFVPAQMNYDLSSGMDENLFFQKWGICKYSLVFNKQKWLENFY